jgi:hypothetical protein
MQICSGQHLAPIAVLIIALLIFRSAKVVSSVPINKWHQFSSYGQIAGTSTGDTLVKTKKGN